MTTFTRSDALRGAEFAHADLKGARFVGADLSGVVMRGVDLLGADIESPWLFDDDGSLLVNGVDVVPLIDAELDRRFPGRAERRAVDPDGLRPRGPRWSGPGRPPSSGSPRCRRAPSTTRWPASGPSRRRSGTWCWPRTCGWAGPSSSSTSPSTPSAWPDAGAEEDGLDMSVFATGTPSYAEVLEARADRVAMVRDFLAAVTPEELDTARQNPWAPAYGETTRSCLHVILDEEWEHHRYAVRDLDAIEAGARQPLTPRRRARHAFDHDGGRAGQVSGRQPR